jgi:iron complex outermembrane receptor protein
VQAVKHGILFAIRWPAGSLASACPDSTERLNSQKLRGRRVNFLESGTALQCKRLKWIAIVALLSVSMTATLLAQAAGTLQGNVTDSKGGLIAGVKLSLRSDSTAKSTLATADGQGHFVINGLAPGSYSLEASATGFRTVNLKGIQVGADTNAPLALTLQVTDATDEVTVDANETHSIAAKLAPMDALLDETSARTEITSTMINNFTSPVSDYGEAVEMAPGTFTTNGNGVGLGQSKTNFRGFPDGDYDIKFDGIPWSDTNSVSHHSWAFFPTQFLGGIDFDRSPGTASTIGYAPFGGSINLLSKPFSAEQNIRGGVSYGSFNTKLFDFEYDSGSFGPSKNLSLNLEVHHLGSDGYQTWNHQTRNGGDIHVQYKLGQKTTLTGFSGVIWLDANTPNFTATRCQMYGAGASYTCTGANAPFAGSGINFLLTNNSDPLLYLDNQYNYYHVPTDFEYVGLHSDLGHGFVLDFKPYTYNYDNSEKYSNAVPITDNPALLNTTYAPLGVTITALCNNPGTIAKPGFGCGVDKYNSYRTYGETSQLSQVSKFGIFRAGMWYSWSNTNRHQFPADPLQNWLDATLPNFAETFVSDAYQPFAEYEFHIGSKFSVTPGVKFDYYTIGTKQFADNGGKIGGLGTNNPATFIANGGSYFSTLPAVAGNYHIRNNWSVYAQYATGTIAPPSSTFDFAQSASGTPVATQPQQQKTSTYQTGTVVKMRRATLDLSYYHVHFGSGYSSFTPLDTGEPIYYPTPPAVTQGVEAESNISLTHGLSLYLNASYTSAKYDGNAVVYCTPSATGCTSTTTALTVPTPSGLWVADTPSDVLTEGLTYQNKGWDFAIFNKTVGTQRLDDAGFHNEATLSPFTLTNMFLNYTLRGGSHFDNTKLRLSFNNLFNEHNVTGDSIATKDKAATITANGTSYADPFNSSFTVAPVSGADAVSILPGRSVMFSVIFGFSPKGR